ncbi:MAG TPA: UDP-N-acetylmuramate dehydrogenase [Acidobacteriota bacterium]|nr:UDP-N-acetylmuramate dehydrogenase [Acidobacteriota bacterium]
MNKRQKEELVGQVKERVQFECPMAEYTTWRVGGMVEALYTAQDVDELRQVIRYLNQEQVPYLVVGRGSNLLVRDGGLEGVAIFLSGALAVVELEQENDLRLVAGAGLPVVDLLNYCRGSGLGGLEFLGGIPGTIGGTIAMNAGAFGCEIGDRVLYIQVITSSGEVIRRDKTQLTFSYRKLKIEEGSVIVMVGLNVDQESPEVVSMRVANYLKRRKKSQPLEYPSAGSVFRNPPNGYAGQLIEEAGLKGKRIGGAMISDKHANFIINTGGAQAKDILALMCLAQEEVKRRTGIELQPEIQVVGR